MYALCSTSATEGLRIKLHIHTNTYIHTYIHTYIGIILYVSIPGSTSYIKHTPWSPSFTWRVVFQHRKLAPLLSYSCGQSMLNYSIIDPSATINSSSATGSIIVEISVPVCVHRFTHILQSVYVESCCKTYSHASCHISKLPARMYACNKWTHK